MAKTNAGERFQLSVSIRYFYFLYLIEEMATGRFASWPPYSFWFCRRAIQIPITTEWNQKDVLCQW